MIYLVEKYSQVALVNEIQKGQRLLAMCVNNEPIPNLQKQNQIIDYFNGLAGNKILFAESLLFLEDKISTLYNEITNL